MVTCASCGARNDDGSAFCLNCGAAIAALPAAMRPAAGNSGGSQRAAPVVAHVERHIYFNVARVITWVLALVALIGMGFSLVKLLPALSDFNAGPQAVSEQQVRAAVDRARRGGGFVSEESVQSDDNVSAGELAALDRAIYDLVLALPPELQKQSGGMDGMRAWVKNSLAVARPEGLDEQIELVGDAKRIVAKLPPADQQSAVAAYFELVARNKQEAVVRNKEATMKVALNAGAFATSAMMLVMVTMCLVLMAIERNTRA